MVILVLIKVWLMVRLRDGKIVLIKCMNETHSHLYRKTLKQVACGYIHP